MSYVSLWVMSLPAKVPIVRHYGPSPPRNPDPPATWLVALTTTFLATGQRNALGAQYMVNLQSSLIHPPVFPPASPLSDIFLTSHPA